MAALSNSKDKNPQKRGSAVSGEARSAQQLFIGELARAFVPTQVYTTRFDLEEGLSKGTIFPELYKPYQHAER